MPDIPVKYRTASPVNVTVGVTDLATGKSRVDLYAGTASGSTVTSVGDGVLSNVAFYSDKIATRSANVYKYFDLDFDLPQTIEGQTIIQLPLIMHVSGTPSVIRTRVGFDISGSATAPHKTLVSGSTTSLSSANVDHPSEMKAVMLDFPQTTFTKGQQLRFWYYNHIIAGAGTQALVGHDPQGRAGGRIPGSNSDAISGSAITSKLVIQTPFNLNL